MPILVCVSDLTNNENDILYQFTRPCNPDDYGDFACSPDDNCWPD